MDSKPHDGTKVKDAGPAGNTQLEKAGASKELSATGDIETARKFLADDNVKNASRSQKALFLKAKGLRDDQIDLLLDEPEQNAIQRSDSEAKPRNATPAESSGQGEDMPPLDTRKERAPIVTYPEFLARPPHPPPLLTPDTLFNTIYAVAGVSTLVYGASTFFVEPMMESLNEARRDLLATTSHNLDLLVSKLESVVSEIPPAARKKSPAETASEAGGVDGSVSEHDDPAELFSRDVGTQTTPSSARREPSLFNNSDLSPGGSRFPSGGLPGEPVSHHHARQLVRLVASVSMLRDDLVTTTEDLQYCQGSIDNLHEEIEELTVRPGTDGVLPSARKNFYHNSSSGWTKLEEPDDEVKKMRDSIQRLKGAMLGARSFPFARPFS